MCRNICWPSSNTHQRWCTMISWSERSCINGASSLHRLRGWSSNILELVRKAGHL
jgi:hypothetical protein